MVALAAPGTATRAGLGLWCRLAVTSRWSGWRDPRTLYVVERTNAIIPEAAEDAWPAKGASSDQRYRPRGASIGPAPRRLQPELLVPAGRGAAGRAQQDTGSVLRRRGDCPGQDRDRQGLRPGGSLRPPPV